MAEFRHYNQTQNSKVLASHLSLSSQQTHHLWSGNWVSEEIGQRHFTCSGNSISSQTQWQDPFSRGTDGCLWAYGLQTFRKRRCFSQTSWGNPSGPGQDNLPHEEARWGLKVPVALRRWAYGRADILIGYRSIWANLWVISEKEEEAALKKQPPESHPLWQMPFQGIIYTWPSLAPA